MVYVLFLYDKLHISHETGREKVLSSANSLTPFLWVCRDTIARKTASLPRREK